MNTFVVNIQKKPAFRTTLWGPFMNQNICKHTCLEISKGKGLIPVVSDYKYISCPTTTFLGVVDFKDKNLH